MWPAHEIIAEKDVFQWTLLGSNLRYFEKKRTGKVKKEMTLFWNSFGTFWEVHTNIKYDNLLHATL